MAKRSKLTDAERKERAKVRWQKWNEAHPGKNRERARQWAKENPEKNRERARQWAKENPERAKEKSKQWRAANPARKKSLDLERNYGITLAQRDHMFAAQGFRCAICSSSDPGSKTGWHTDHCHDTEAVRGILCHHCNLMLGNARDNPATLLAAVEYLRKHSNGVGVHE